MCHAVARLLILFILSANLAWAADMDELYAAPESGKVLAGADQQDPGHEAWKNTPCGHCCHATAHYVGLPPVSLSSFQSVDCVVEPGWLAAIYSLDKEPPLPPPNI